MKRYWLLTLLLMLFLPMAAQQIMYANLDDLVRQQGDTASILLVERRAKKNIYLTGGADYRIFAYGNQWLSRYLKVRCYAVQIDTALYVNCRRIHYRRYHFGHWYASAMRVNGKIYFAAQPLGQVATQNILPDDLAKLGGQVGDAINASSLVNYHVYYEINNETGKAEFVGKEKMNTLLAPYPELLQSFTQAGGESAEVTGKYLKALKDVAGE